MTTPDEATIAAEHARQRLAEELHRRLTEDADREQQRRQHAMWCAAMTYAERGERISSDDVLIRAEKFLDWLDRPECRCDLRDVSIPGGPPQYLRGRTNGCLRHYDPVDAAARRKARE